MEKEQIHKRFLDLRAQGLSFQEIAVELETTEEELISLTKTLQDNVKNRGCGC